MSRLVDVFIEQADGPSYDLPLLNLDAMAHAGQVLKLCLKVMDTYNPKSHCTVCDMTVAGQSGPVHRPWCPVPELKRLIER